MSQAPRSQDGGERLEGWKEIAAYLRREVRTVQRWEKSGGLPVRRHQHARRAVPYAFEAELDDWWHSTSGRAATSENGESTAPRSRPALNSRVTVAVGALVLAALCATQSADARPNDLLSNATAAWMLVLANDQNAAQVYLERSRSLAAQDPAESIASWVRLFPAYRSWLDADARETLRLVDSEPSIPVSDSLNQSLDIRAGWYIALGQLAKAQGLILTKSADDPSRELMLTTIALARGRDDLAATHVEKLVDGSYDLFDGPDTAYYWLRTQDQLAELYRRQGRLSDARRVEDRLLALLAVADDDHAILRRIRERRAGDS